MGVHLKSVARALTVEGRIMWLFFEGYRKKLETGTLALLAGWFCVLSLLTRSRSLGGTNTRFFTRIWTRATPSNDNVDLATDQFIVGNFRYRFSTSANANVQWCAEPYILADALQTLPKLSVKAYATKAAETNSRYKLVWQRLCPIRLVQKRTHPVLLYSSDQAQTRKLHHTKQMLCRHPVVSNVFRNFLRAASSTPRDPARSGTAVVGRSARPRHTKKGKQRWWTISSHRPAQQQLSTEESSMWEVTRGSLQKVRRARPFPTPRLLSVDISMLNLSWTHSFGPLHAF